MNMIVRMLWLALRSRRWPRLRPTDVSRTPFRVRLSDLDVLRHMNNGIYLSIMDLGRIDLMRRSGTFQRVNERGWYPVVVAQTITYRRSLELGQKFDLETALLGVDDKSVFIEQRFVVAGQIYAQAIVRARFLKRSGGTVPMEELIEVVEGEELPELPAWVAQWTAQTALPPSRAEAPSTWGDRIPA